MSCLVPRFLLAVIARIGYDKEMSEVQRDIPRLAPCFVGKKMPRTLMSLNDLFPGLKASYKRIKNFRDWSATEYGHRDGRRIWRC
jgi:hypothetical protein